jgi:hypothetical protein
MPSLDGGEIHLLFCKNIVGRPEVRRRRRRRRRRQTPPRARSAAPPLVPQRVCSCHPAAASQPAPLRRSVGRWGAGSECLCLLRVADGPTGPHDIYDPNAGDVGGAGTAGDPGASAGAAVQGVAAPAPARALGDRDPRGRSRAVPPQVGHLDYRTVHTPACLPRSCSTGAGEENGIDHNKN